jgi:hypothetical protein
MLVHPRDDPLSGRATPVHQRDDPLRDSGYTAVHHADNPLRDIEELQGIAGSLIRVDAGQWKILEVIGRLVRN